MLIDRPWIVGLGLGVLFGSANLVLAWLRPLDDDTPGALLRFYGPMFLAWAAVAFRAARRTGRLQSGMTAGTAVACATFTTFSLLVLLRVELFLDVLSARADWQRLVMRFRQSDFESLRAFVTLDYIKGLPFKIGVASAVGGLVGAIGGGLAKSKRLGVAAPASLLVILALAQVTAERRWQTGTWIQMGVRRTAFVGDAANERFPPGPIKPSMTEVATYVIETDERRYDLQGMVAIGSDGFERTVAVGKPIMFAIEKKTAYIKLDTGEYRLLVLKNEPKKTP